MNAALPAPHKQRIRLAGPLILISAGALLLLNNLGYLSWDVWWHLARLWPALIVLVGLQLVLRYYGPGWLRIVAPVVVITGTVAAAVALTLSDGNIMLMPASAEGGYLDGPLTGLEQGEVNISFGAGRLLLGSLDSDSNLFFSGDFQNGTSEAVRKEFRGENGRAFLSLRSNGRVVFPFASNRYNEWDLKLTRRLPLDVTVKAGGAEAQLDLTNLGVGNLNVEVGASKAEIKFPSASEMTRASIKAGLGDLTLIIPQDVAARIRTKADLVDFSANANRFGRDGDFYTTGDWGSAAHKLEVNVDGGLARIAVR